MTSSSRAARSFASRSRSSKDDETATGGDIVLDTVVGLRAGDKARLAGGAGDSGAWAGEP